MHVTYGSWIGIAWCVFLLVWLITGFATKRTERKEEGWKTAVRSVVICGMIYFLYFSPPALAWLHQRVVPDTEAWHAAGVTLTFLGVAFAIWARLALGSNWSAKVTIKRDHELIVRGPYRIVRNPIYTGMFLALAGTAAGLGQVRHFLPLPIMTALWTWKTMQEQQLLREQFGDAYAAYCQKVKAVIPYLL